MIDSMHHRSRLTQDQNCGIVVQETTWNRRTAVVSGSSGNSVSVSSVFSPNIDKSLKYRKTNKRQSFAQPCQDGHIMSEQNKMPRRPLPLGYQSFSDLRQDGCYYVDKTPLIRQMIDERRYCFLSRPAISARVFWSIPCWNCSRAMNPCFEDWAFIRTGTGRSSTP